MTLVSPPALTNIPTARNLFERRHPLTRATPWALASLAGRFIALEMWPESGSANLSFIVGLIREVQEAEGFAVWIAQPRCLFFPPDFTEAGVDLAALPIVRAPDSTKAARAADTLLRSGSFALIVLDGDGQALPLALQTRLAGLAHQHHTALVCLRTPGEATTRGSLVSLRCTTQKRRTGHDCFSCELRAVKDKRQTPGWTHQELRHGPDGLC